jgi:hypothetical protein
MLSQNNRLTFLTFKTSSNIHNYLILNDKKSVTFLLIIITKILSLQPTKNLQFKTDIKTNKN